MPTLDVKVEGAKELRSSFDRLTVRAKQRARDAINVGALMVQKAGRENCAVDRGRLRASIVPEFFKDGTAAEIGPHVAYAAHVEYGTGPHKSAKGTEEFVAEITEWAWRVLGVPEDKVYPIIRHIRKHGTRPHPFMAPAWEETRAKIEEELRKVAKYIERKGAR